MAGIYALLAFLTVCEALQQGPLTWVLREFVPVEYKGKSLKKYTGPALVPEGGPRVAFAILGTAVGIGLYVVSHKDTK